MSTVVTTTTLRKFRKRTRSRSAAELAARTVVTILPRSALDRVLLVFQVFVVALRQGAIRIIDAKPPGNPLELQMMLRSS
jgi:hypothetical protein